MVMRFAASVSLLLAAVAVASWAAVGVAGADWWVDAATGSDSTGNGSSAAPFRTVGVAFGAAINASALSSSSAPATYEVVRLAVGAAQVHVIDAPLAVPAGAHISLAAAGFDRAPAAAATAAAACAASARDLLANNNPAASDDYTVRADLPSALATFRSAHALATVQLAGPSSASAATAAYLAAAGAGSALELAGVALLAQTGAGPFGPFAGFLPQLADADAAAAQLAVVAAGPGAGASLRAVCSLVASDGAAPPAAPRAAAASLGGADVALDGAVTFGFPAGLDAAKASGAALAATGTAFLRHVAGAAARGGAVSWGGSSASFSGCVFGGNEAAAGGALALAAGGAQWTIDQCVFAENVAMAPSSGLGGGGAVLAAGSAVATSSLVVTQSVFSRNNVTGGEAHGGALSLVTVSNATIGQSTVFALNGATGSGGALAIDAGALPTESFHLTDVRFSRNTAQGDGGGAVAVNLGRAAGEGLVVDNFCLFEFNSASAGAGGALLLSGGAQVVRDARFTDNRAASVGGGAIAVLEGGAAARGTTIVDSTFTGDVALGGDGGAVYVGQGIVTAEGEPAAVVLENLVVTNTMAATGSGGGIAVAAGLVFGSDLEFVGCEAHGGDGGGLFIADANGFGGSSSSAACVNRTWLAAATAGGGGGGAAAPVSAANEVLADWTESPFVAPLTFTDCSANEGTGGAVALGGAAPRCPALLMALEDATLSGNAALRGQDFGGAPAHGRLEFRARELNEVRDLTERNEAGDDAVCFEDTFVLAAVFEDAFGQPAYDPALTIAVTSVTGAGVVPAGSEDDEDAEEDGLPATPFPSGESAAAEPEILLVEATLFSDPCVLTGEQFLALGSFCENTTLSGTAVIGTGSAARVIPVQNYDLDVYVCPRYLDDEETPFVIPIGIVALLCLISMAITCVGMIVFRNKMLMKEMSLWLMFPAAVGAVMVTLGVITNARDAGREDGLCYARHFVRNLGFILVTMAVLTRTCLVGIRFKSGSQLKGTRRAPAFMYDFDDATVKVSERDKNDDDDDASSSATLASRSGGNKSDTESGNGSELVGARSARLTGFAADWAALRSDLGKKARWTLIILTVGIFLQFAAAYLSRPQQTAGGQCIAVDALSGDLLIVRSVIFILIVGLPLRLIFIERPFFEMRFIAVAGGFYLIAVIVSLSAGTVEPTAVAARDLLDLITVMAFLVLMVWPKFYLILRDQQERAFWESNDETSVRWIEFADLELDDVPIASGSFGVVYKGYYLGSPCVSKVIVGGGGDTGYSKSGTNKTGTIKGTKGTDKGSSKKQKKSKSSGTGGGSSKGGSDSATGTYNQGLKQARAEFLLEAEQLTRVPQYSSIVSFFGLSEDPEGNQYLVSELVEGGSLARLLAADAPLDDRDLASIATNVAGAMRVLHDARILHMDLASRNLLVYKRNPVAVKVCDFGLSHCLTHKQLAAGGLDATGRVFSARWYEPPTSGYFSFASDLYGYGSLLYEVMTRQRPWKRLSIKAANRAIRGGLVQRRPTPIAPATRESTDRLYNIARACWRNQPEDRPSFSKIVLVLRDVTTAIEAFMTREALRLKRKAKRDKKAAAAAAAAAAAEAEAEAAANELMAPGLGYGTSTAPSAPDADDDGDQKESPYLRYVPNSKVEANLKRLGGAYAHTPSFNKEEEDMQDSEDDEFSFEGAGATASSENDDAEGFDGDSDSEADATLATFGIQGPSRHKRRQKKKAGISARGGEDNTIRLEVRGKRTKQQKKKPQRDDKRTTSSSRGGAGKKAGDKKEKHISFRPESSSEEEDDDNDGVTLSSTGSASAGSSSVSSSADATPPPPKKKKDSKHAPAADKKERRRRREGTAPSESLDDDDDDDDYSDEDDFDSRYDHDFDDDDDAAAAAQDDGGEADYSSHDSSDDNDSASASSLSSSSAEAAARKASKKASKKR